MLIQTQLTGEETDVSDLQQICFQIETEIKSPFFASVDDSTQSTIKPPNSPPKPLLFSQEEPSKHPIIFLDVDGVLYPYPHPTSGVFRTYDSTYTQLKKIHNPMLMQHLGCSLRTLNKMLDFDFSAVARVKKLCETTGARIVISSDWRKKKNLTQIKNIFQLLGLGQWVISYTDQLDGDRGAEIQKWLTEQMDQVSSFVIIDDNIFDFEELFPKEFVHCKPEVGFSSTKLDQASVRLKTPLSYHESDLESLWNKIKDGSLPKKFKMSYEEAGIIARHENRTIMDVMKLVRAALSTTSTIQMIWLRGFPEDFNDMYQDLLSNQNLQRLSISECEISCTKRFVHDVQFHPRLNYLELEENLGFKSHHIDSLLKCTLHKIGFTLKVDDYEMSSSEIMSPLSKKSMPV